MEKNISEFMSNMRSMEPEERVTMLQDISAMFKETLKHGEDKVALAIQTYDMVCIASENWAWSAVEGFGLKLITYFV